jgi:hypothetical protein
LAGIGSALAPHIVAFAQTSTPSSGATPARPDSAAAPAAPSEISADARSLAEIIRRRYGKHLDNDQLEAVTRELDSRLRGGKAMRDVKLANGDEPDFTFQP